MRHLLQMKCSIALICTYIDMKSPFSQAHQFSASDEGARCLFGRGKASMAVIMPCLGLYSGQLCSLARHDLSRFAASGHTYRNIAHAIEPR